LARARPRFPCPDDGHALSVGDAQLLTYPHLELGDGVSDATDSVEVDVGEIPANVGGVCPGRLGELL
jgi:hypothetical protein